MALEWQCGAGQVISSGTRLSKPGRIEPGFAKLIGAPAEFFEYQL